MRNALQPRRIPNHKVQASDKIPAQILIYDLQKKKRKNTSVEFARSPCA